VGQTTSPPLAGFKVIEIGGGAAGGYCGRLLVDAGAEVSVTALSEEWRLHGIVRATSQKNDLGKEMSEADRAYGAYLNAGKQMLSVVSDPLALAQLCSEADLVLVGEASGVDASDLSPRIATLALSWLVRMGRAVLGKVAISLFKP
jgi:hypothetical protein